VAKNLNKTTIINIDMERENYTMHGFHQNKKGKMILSTKIPTAIQEIVGTQIGNAAIPLNWHTILKSSEITKGIVQPSKITSRNHLYNPEAKKSNGSEVKSQALIHDQEALHRNSRRR
jgi:hypothetical protein